MMGAAVAPAAGPSPQHERTGAPRAAAWARRLAQWGILAYLLHRVWGLGWQEVLRALPVQPAFYLIGLALFAALPIGELLGYRRLLPLPAAGGLRALLRKRTYNKEILGYSGEVLFYFWVWRDLGVPERTAFHAVKANNVVSTLCSTLWALAALAAMLAWGDLPAVRDRFPTAGSHLAAGLSAVAIAVLALVFFRRQLLGVPPRTALWLGGAHLGRLALVTALRIAQWASVLPDVPLAAWFGLLACEIAITRLPFLPGKDLVFAGAVVDLAPAAGVPAAPMLAMLVAQGVLDRLLNSAVLLFPARREARDVAATRSPSPAPGS